MKTWVEDFRVFRVCSHSTKWIQEHAKHKAETVHGSDGIAVGIFVKFDETEISKSTTGTLQKNHVNKHQKPAKMEGTDLGTKAFDLWSPVFFSCRCITKISFDVSTVAPDYARCGLLSLRHSQTVDKALSVSDAQRFRTKTPGT